MLVYSVFIFLLLGLFPIFLEKKLFPHLLEKNITMRPKNSVKETSGFPSGHVQITSFVATYLTLCLMNTEELFVILIFFWLSVLFVSYERIKSENHIHFQVLFGIFFGIIFALISYIPIYIVKNEYMKSYEIVKTMKKYFNLN